MAPPPPTPTAINIDTLQLRTRFVRPSLGLHHHHHHHRMAPTRARPVRQIAISHIASRTSLGIVQLSTYLTLSCLLAGRTGAGRVTGALRALPDRRCCSRRAERGRAGPGPPCGPAAWLSSAAVSGGQPMTAPRSVLGAGTGSRWPPLGTAGRPSRHDSEQAIGLTSTPVSQQPAHRHQAYHSSSGGGGGGGGGGSGGGSSGLAVATMT